MRAMELKQARQERRVIRVRKKVVGSAERPRLAVSRSNKNLYVQIIDDFNGRTLCAISTLSKEMQAKLGKSGANVKAASVIGKAIGEKARALGIEQVAFDRRGSRYHGRVKALADGAREAGLKF
ncbi:MAG: 50S ribosomal protein L18 [Phycisphaerae bacterium]|nr:50S ribosomal protein L18 [Phycisphaerae bacterium]